jgi:hypothetical protein
MPSIDAGEQSRGQRRANARNAPLVLDQPEDNPDNRFISEGVVPKMKSDGGNSSSRRTNLRSFALSRMATEVPNSRAAIILDDQSPTVTIASAG